jgi:Flp pilus assembly protein TadB
LDDERADTEARRVLERQIQRHRQPQGRRDHRHRDEPVASPAMQWTVEPTACFHNDRTNSSSLRDRGLRVGRHVESHRHRPHRHGDEHPAPRHHHLLRVACGALIVGVVALYVALPVALVWSLVVAVVRRRRT